ncbi:uncharacterized protein LOC127263365 [Andrographis paniculata]|uniref:uncharacterized protein LOC127263365 n=1 Tax=Andrographis paniculata TaxID=175694 RepID=UPI0021E887E1|nr:uncharacterized protein LOC127263365 [Andrographis paniculata]
MGSGISRRRRPADRRPISSFLACGVASLSREPNDRRNELLPNSAEHSDKKKSKSLRKNSTLSSSNGKDLISIDAEGCLNGNENRAPGNGASIVGHESKGKCLSEYSHRVLRHRSMDEFKGNDLASTSNLNQPTPYSASTAEMFGIDSVNGLKNSDSVSVENDVDVSGSDFSSPSDSRFLIDDSLEEAAPVITRTNQISQRLPGTPDSVHRHRAVEPSMRAGISRIVMLAEALFEVLDQIHQPPITYSSSLISLPAPDLVVDSFPLKTHSKAEKLATPEDFSQCYICLSEYEEGDKVRVLPCRHEFHMPCVDKWLKEIHGVCPLCRDDVGKDST